jgi:hypothetical protein
MIIIILDAGGEPEAQDHQMPLVAYHWACHCVLSQPSIVEKHAGRREG